MLKLYEPSKNEEVYYSLIAKLKSKYDPESYIVINPETEDYFVGETSVEAMKNARKKYPKESYF